MSLNKIPFILLATWGFQAAATPPHPPAPKHEQIPAQVPVGCISYLRWTPFIAIVLQWCAAIAEIATILASVTPSSPISEQFLSSIVWNDGEPANLHMSNAIAVGFTFLMLGSWIRLMTFRYLGQFFRFEASIQKDHELIDYGPYAVVRHPGYTGTMLIFIGWFPWQLGRGSWVVESGFGSTVLGRTLLLAYINLFIFGLSYILLTRMAKEDVALRSQFGKKWDDWAKKVPYSIFPGIY